MRSRFAFVMLAGLLVAADDAKKEEEAILGTWVVVKAEREGMGVTGDNGPIGHKLAFEKGGKATYQRKGADELKTGTYKMDTTKTPKQITITPDEGEEKPGKAIYKLVGDTLTICVTHESEAPPKEFKTEEGSMNMLLVLERQKP